jgi:ABC-type multidrug transport system fused ATPase/permease subunit
MDFFRLSTAALAILLIAVLAGSVAIGVLVGRVMRDRPGTRHETAGVVQGALLGLVGLLLAFGLSMAVGRYESRRALVVQEANDIGTTYLRAQLLAEPERSRSMELLAQYTDATIEVADAVPDTGSYRDANAKVETLQGELWTLATDAVAADPVGTGPRLYTETLNETFDTHTSRVASLGNRVPTPVMVLLVVGSAVAVGALAFYLTLLGKGLATSLITAAVVLIILFVSFDLDRPRRGFIQVPDAPLVQLRESFDQP